MLIVTEAAARQVRHAAREGGAEGMPLRLAAKQREDGSIDYLMGFDDKRIEDLRVLANDIEVVIAPEYVPLLDGATMVFVEIEAGEYRFIFLNPNDETYIPPQGV